MLEPSLPPFLMTSDPGSFARATILERKPQIIRQVLADNTYPPEIVSALEDFRDEIASRTIQPLTESVLDVPDWNHELAQYSGKTWLEIPLVFCRDLFLSQVVKRRALFPARRTAGSGSIPKTKAETDGGRCSTSGIRLGRAIGAGTGDALRSPVALQLVGQPRRLE